MELNLEKFNNLLSDLRQDKYLEENLHRIITEIEEEITFQSLGIYLHSHSENIFRLKIGRNVSHSFSKKVTFKDDCEFIQTLSDLKVKNLYNDDKFQFEKKYSNLIIIPLHNNNILFGFVFLDKAKGNFSNNDIIKACILSSIISLGINLNELRDEVFNMKILDDTLQIYTHKAFTDRSEFVFSSMFRYNKPLILTVFKINAFNKLKGTFGKTKMNETMAEVGSIIKKFLRTTDLAGKIYKDTVAILMPETTVEKAEIVIRRVDKLICDLEVLKGQKLGWGIAALDKNIEDVHQLLHNAEEASFEAIRKYDDNIAVYCEKRG
ncbi:MAG: GGDEF domain-containing protein [Candidatus Cloacimonetes bacterium]|nr:GGDEF domain-containing protein [Candidatus Cloacimonadota bacterium]